MHQTHVPLRQGEGEAGGHEGSLTGVQGEVYARAQIGARIARFGVGGGGQLGVEHFDLNVNGVNHALHSTQAEAKNHVGTRLLPASKAAVEGLRVRVTMGFVTMSVVTRSPIVTGCGTHTLFPFAPNRLLEGMFCDFFTRRIVQTAVP